MNERGYSMNCKHLAENVNGSLKLCDMDNKNCARIKSNGLIWSSRGDYLQCPKLVKENKRNQDLIVIDRLSIKGSSEYPADITHRQRRHSAKTRGGEYNE